jgi:hypothetical protein
MKTEKQLLDAMSMAFAATWGVMGYPDRERAADIMEAYRTDETVSDELFKEVWSYFRWLSQHLNDGGRFLKVDPPKS